MEFKNLKSLAGLKRLNDYLETRSYITGFTPSQNDVTLIQSLPSDIGSKTEISNVKRWHSHIHSFSKAQQNDFPQSSEVIKISSEDSNESPQSPPNSNTSIEKTNLLYFPASPPLECTSKVLKIEPEEGHKEPNCYSVILNQTVCHPQGGGQPFDPGYIYGNGSQKFQILDARLDRETECVKHIGKFTEDPFNVGDQVKVEIDKDKRFLYSRLHSAGHLVDAALRQLGYDWPPVKGYHFPNGPYVEYKGTLAEAEREKLKANLEKKSNELIAEESPISISLDVNPNDAAKQCGELDPIWLSQPSLRLMSVGEYFSFPCGGTHVENLSQLNAIKIPKIKIMKSKGLIQVRYDII